MTHYDTLGIGPDADQYDIKKAYRRKAQESHPDRGGDTERFRQIQLAYDVLGDSARKERYDKTGESDKPESVENEIEQALASLFDRIISMEKPPANIIKAARSQVSENQGRIRSEQQAAKSKLTRLSKLLGRVAAKGHNLFDGVLNQKIEGLNRAIADCEQALALLAGVITMLDAYEDLAPEKDEPKTEYTLRPNMLYGSTFFNGGGP